MEITSKDGTVDIFRKIGEDSRLESVTLDEIMYSPKIRKGKINCYVFAKEFSHTIMDMYLDTTCYIDV